MHYKLYSAIFYISLCFFFARTLATPAAARTNRTAPTGLPFNFPCKTSDAVNYAFVPVNLKPLGFYLPFQSEIGNFVAEDIFEIGLQPLEDLPRRPCLRSIFTPQTPDGIHVQHRVLGYCGRSITFNCVNLFPKSINHCTFVGTDHQYDHINVVTLTDNATYECARRCWRNGITDFVCISTTRPKDIDLNTKCAIELELARLGSNPPAVLHDSIFDNNDGCHFTDDNVA